MLSRGDDLNTGTSCGWLLRVARVGPLEPLSSYIQNELGNGTIARLDANMPRTT